MRVFVTGAAGYIGSVVADQLIQAGHEVIGFDNLKSGHRQALNVAAELVQGDIQDAEALYRSLQDSRADGVMHLAGEIVVSESYQNPGLHFQVNVSGSVNLLEAMNRVGIKRIVFSSSAAVYGEPSEIPINEGAQKAPVSPYGESKLQFERILDWYGRIHGFKHCSLRYFNACGATKRNGEDRPIETHLIPILLDVVEGKRANFTLFGNDYPTPDGTCVRDYIHVADIARAHVLVLEALDQIESPAYNLGTGEGKSNLQVIQAVEKAAGRSIPHKIEARRQGDPAVLVASADLIQKQLGWKPEVKDLDDMAASAWQWRLDHPNGYED